MTGPNQEQGKQARAVSGRPTQEDMQWMKERIEEEGSVLPQTEMDYAAG